MLILIGNQMKYSEQKLHRRIINNLHPYPSCTNIPVKAILTSMQDLAFFRVLESQDHKFGSAPSESLFSSLGSEKFCVKWDSQPSEPLLSCLWYILYHRQRCGIALLGNMALKSYPKSVWIQRCKICGRTVTLLPLKSPRDAKLTLSQQQQFTLQKEILFPCEFKLRKFSLIFVFRFCFQWYFD